MKKVTINTYDHWFDFSLVMFDRKTKSPTKQESGGKQEAFSRKP